MKKKYNFRADEGLISGYQEFAEANGRNFTELILLALKKYTKKPDKDVCTELKRETVPQTPKDCEPLSVRTDLSNLKRREREVSRLDISDIKPMDLSSIEPGTGDEEEYIEPTGRRMRFIQTIIEQAEISDMSPQQKRKILDKLYRDNRINEDELNYLTKHIN